MIGAGGTSGASMCGFCQAWIGAELRQPRSMRPMPCSSALVADLKDADADTLSRDT